MLAPDRWGQRIRVWVVLARRATEYRGWGAQGCIMQTRLRDTALCQEIWGCGRCWLD